jgi:hypothetical protein
VLAQLLFALHASATSVGARYPAPLVDLLNVPPELTTSTEPFVAPMAQALVDRYRRIL